MKQTLNGGCKSPTMQRGKVNMSGTGISLVASDGQLRWYPQRNMLPMIQTQNARRKWRVHIFRDAIGVTWTYPNSVWTVGSEFRWFLVVCAGYYSMCSNLWPVPALLEILRYMGNIGIKIPRESWRNLGPSMLRHRSPILVSTRDVPRKRGSDSEQFPRKSMDGWAFAHIIDLYFFLSHEYCLAVVYE